MKRKTVLQYTTPTLETLVYTRRTANQGTWLCIGLAIASICAGKWLYGIVLMYLSLQFRFIKDDLNQVTKYQKFLSNIGK